MLYTLERIKRNCEINGMNEEDEVGYEWQRCKKEDEQR